MEKGTSERSTRLTRTAGEPVDIPRGNLAQLFLDAVDTYGKPDALKHKRAGAWHSVSHKQVYDDVKRAALGLEALGIGRGDRVVILSWNRPEWLVADFACVMSRAISVPLYPVLLAEQIEYMVANSEARAAFVSDEDQLEKIQQVRGVAPELKHIITFMESPPAGAGVISLRDLLRKGEERAGVPDDEYRSRALAADPDDVLTILYTSGTTGQPKGVMLTHNNLYSNVKAVLRSFDINVRDVSLSVLPLSHIFERMAGHYVMFDAGVTICYAEEFAVVAQNILEIRPTVMTMVPRGYEKIYARVREVAREGGKERILDWAIGVGGKHLERKISGKAVGPWLGLQYLIADRLVFAKLRKQVGGRIRFFVSGGAPLSAELARFFNGAGLKVLEGYGLTETSPVIAFNTPKEMKLGTVGKPIPGVEVGIAEDGEILTRGPHVMKGYYKNREETERVIEPDGWFHTGDIGELDEEGYLAITDRKKDLIVTAGGKNIAPQPIENRAKNHPLVSQAVMIGDRRRFAALLIEPDFDALEKWARERGLEFEDRESLCRNPDVVEQLEDQILGEMDDLARYERPKKIALIPKELTIEDGEITPTLKVKRRVIEEKFSDIIEGLYKEE